jgi:hypothetical protein
MKPSDRAYGKQNCLVTLGKGVDAPLDVVATQSPERGTQPLIGLGMQCGTAGRYL